MASGSSEGSATNGAAITPSDAADLPRVTNAIYVGGAGTVNIQWVGGTQSNSSFTCVAGQTLNVRAKRVWSTGTSATLLVALYSN